METERPTGWNVTASEIVIETPHLRLRRDRIELPDGKQIGNYYVRESRGFTVIFALTTDERVVLVRQYKHGIAQTLLELPAGGIDPGETPLECAVRELREETGYVCEPEALEHLGSFVYDPTSSTTRYELYFGRDARQIASQDLDDTEQIAIEYASLEEVRRHVCDGTIVVGVHIASIYYVLDHLGMLG